MTLPTDHEARKRVPLATWLRGYFPDAIIELAAMSARVNEQHNPGEPVRWAREKSNDHPDCALRHFMEYGTRDKDGERHTAKAAWRLLAMLQLEIEADRSAEDFAKEVGGPEGLVKNITPTRTPFQPMAEIANRYVPGERQGIYYHSPLPPKGRDA